MIYIGVYVRDIAYTHFSIGGPDIPGSISKWKLRGTQNAEKTPQFNT